MTQVVNINKVQTITSLEIAELTGKQHKHVMEAIRRMEPAWVNMAGSNFRLGSYF
jgi:phage regulator Rha-like protein